MAKNLVGSLPLALYVRNNHAASAVSTRTLGIAPGVIETFPTGTAPSPLSESSTPELKELSAVAQKAATGKLGISLSTMTAAQSPIRTVEATAVVTANIDVNPFVNMGEFPAISRILGEDSASDVASASAAMLAVAKERLIAALPQRMPSDDGSGTIVVPVPEDIRLIHPTSPTKTLTIKVEDLIASANYKVALVTALEKMNNKVDVKFKPATPFFYLNAGSVQRVGVWAAAETTYGSKIEMQRVDAYVYWDDNDNTFSASFSPAGASDKDSLAVAAAQEYDGKLLKFMNFRTQGFASSAYPEVAINDLKTRPAATAVEAGPDGLTNATAQQMEAWWMNRQAVLTDALAVKPTVGAAPRAARDAAYTAATNAGTFTGTREQYEAAQAAALAAAKPTQSTSWLSSLWEGAKEFGSGAVDLMKSWGPIGTTAAVAGVTGVATNNNKLLLIGAAAVVAILLLK